MIDRIIAGPTGSRLRDFVAKQAVEFAASKDLPIVVVTSHYEFDHWKTLIPFAKRDSPWSCKGTLTSCGSCAMYHFPKWRI